MESNMESNMQNNMQNPLIHILWDASPLWGHLVLNAVIQTGLSYSIIHTKAKSKNASSEEVNTYTPITEQLTGKILIVPGGFGRMKEEILGEEGKKAICNFVADGGTYIGFCGGAGLALTHKGRGLGLCPWGRGVYNSRLEHLVSGHIISSIAQDTLLEKAGELPLPVWWPGRFQEPNIDKSKTESDNSVRVIARYKSIGADLYVADMPLTKLPQTVFEDWEHLYGVTLLPHLLNNEPVIIAGDYGKGQYVLSYSHLETPHSPDANFLFAQILRSCLKNTTHLENLKQDEANSSIQNINQADTFLAEGIEPSRAINTEKNIFNSEYKPIWLSQIEYVEDLETKHGCNKENIFSSNNTILPLLIDLYTLLEELFQLGVDLHLLFPRNKWLYGWHTSVPGSQLNALRVALLQSLFFKPNFTRVAFFQENSREFVEKMRLFIHGAKTWFLARKLSEVMGATPEQGSVSKDILQKQRNELFGQHMAGGGLCGELIDWLNELLFCTE